MKNLVGIDLGTQSAKVEICTPDGISLARATQPLRPTRSPYPGAVEHPDDDLWEALALATRQAVARYEIDGGRVGDLAAVGLCGIRNCRALLDERGALAQPVMSWMDERVVRAHEATPGVRWVTASSGYLTGRLTGVPRDSISAYRGLWPSSLTTRDWDPDRFDECGMGREVLVDLVEPGDLLGEVTTPAAEHTGLPPGLPVVATGNDKAVEALGCGLTGAGDVLISLGTYIAAMTPTSAPDEGLQHSWTNFAAVPGGYLRESAGVRRGMWTVSWVRDLVGAQSVAELDLEAVALPPGTDGLTAIPDWLAPADQPHRRGALVGFDDRHGAAHLHRAVMEGICFRMARHTEAMMTELASPISSVTLSGGGAASVVAHHAVSALFDAPVCIPASEKASPAALGAAICAAVGSGVHRDFTDAVDAMSLRRHQVAAVSDQDRKAYRDAAVRHLRIEAAVEAALRPDGR